MSKKILLVEDDHSITSMYQMQLRSNGYSVTVASDGAEGLKKAEEDMPDLVLLDLRMPVMTGDVMLEKMRDTEWGQEIPVICLTNISRDEAPRSLRFLNIEHFIVKALHTPTQVLEIVRETFSEIDYRNRHN